MKIERKLRRNFEENQVSGKMGLVHVIQFFSAVQTIDITEVHIPWMGIRTEHAK